MKKFIRRTPWLVVGATAISLKLAVTQIDLPDGKREFSQIRDVIKKDVATDTLLPAFMPFIAVGGDSAQGYKIARSLRFNSADTTNLTWTPAAGNRKTYTASLWVKRAVLGTTQHFFTAHSGASDDIRWGFDTSDRLAITYARSGGSDTGARITSASYRDPTAWMHVVIAVDTSQATASDRCKIYVNGNLITAFSSSSDPDQNTDTTVNAAVTHAIGGSATRAGWFNGYLTEINFVDGQQLDATYFGQSDPLTNTWVPKKYTGTYGTNGFHLDFSDNSNTTSTTLGKDRSGNDNDWTPNNFSVAAGPGNDSLVDTPTNYGTDTGVGGEVRGNYATMSSLNSFGCTVSDGNLRVTTPAASTGHGRASIPFPAIGKFRASVRVISHSRAGAIGADGMIGIVTAAVSPHSQAYIQAGAVLYCSDGTKRVNGSSSSFGATYTDNNTIDVEVDADAGEVEFLKDGVSQGVITISAGTEYWLVCDDGSSSETVTYAVNFGQQPWPYAPTSGFKALCTQNLPDPAIKNPRDYFDVNTRTGTGAAFNVTGKRFQPDLVWSKSRSAATAHAIYDSVRGVQKDFAIGAVAETTEAQGLTAFNGDGFSGGTLAKINTNTATYVDWLLKQGAIAGFEIVPFTGTGSAQAVNHNIGAVPEFMLHKERANADSWYVYHHKANASPATGSLFLEGTQAFSSSVSYFGNTAPTSTQFTAGVVMSSGSCLAYLFTSIPGFSRFDSYIGNASANGPFVYCGFRPRWILVKNVSQSSSWAIWDVERNTFNPLTAELTPNATSAEDGTSTADIDVTAFGFKIRNSAAAYNGSGNTIVFAAFADVPAKYALAA